MSDYVICTLFSGSSGNCVYIGNENTKILIDAGKSAKAVCSGLESIGVSISDIDAIFITHEHVDHVSALKVLTKKTSLPVYAVSGCADFLASIPAINGERIVAHEPGSAIEVGDLTVSSFRTSHDSACSVGYKITTVDGRTFGVATDTGIITRATGNALTGCEAVILECNHDSDMLRNGPYPSYLKSRISSRFGHLSNGDCARFAAYLAENGTKYFLLAHLSRENNLPGLALDTVRQAVPDKDIRIEVASPCTPTFMFG